MSNRGGSNCIIISILFVISALGWSQSPAEEQGLTSDGISQERQQEYASLAVKWLQEYLRVDTTNPPGNEARATGFFKKLLDQEQIPKTGCLSMRRGGPICGREFPTPPRLRNLPSSC